MLLRDVRASVSLFLGALSSLRWKLSPACFFLCDCDRQTPPGTTYSGPKSSLFPLDNFPYTQTVVSLIFQG